MSIGINISIDLTKIDKSKIVEAKNGKKYLNMTAFINNEKGQYGDNGMITHAQTKEEREAKLKPQILGNATVFWDDAGVFQTQRDQQPAATNAGPDYSAGNDFDDSDIPFMRISHEYVY